MSTPTELWKKWEGRVVDEKFPLRQWLGGSDHSAVFLTGGGESRKAAIKLVSSQNLDEDAQLSCWTASKASHPHLIRLFECGRCQLDGTRLLYVVMECAEEDLAQILPLRRLSSEEASEMLRPTVETLGSLHRAGLVHGRIKPSNIMAVGNQLKLSADGVCKIGGRGNPNTYSAYDAPEAATAGLSPAGDIWSLGITLVAVLTQDEPRLKNWDRGQVAIPETIPQPFREIARQCLQINPQQRCTLDNILGQIGNQPRVREKANETHRSPTRPKRWVILVIALAAILLGALVAGKFILRQEPAPTADIHSAEVQPHADTPAAQSPAPFSEQQKTTQKGVTHGRVLQQVSPDVSRGAQNTITGRVKVSVQVTVDASGNVSEAKLVSPGPSQYFANRALAAARRWRFNPPQVDGKATSSEWLLRFQFGRTSTELIPREMKP
jgi:TonB family protein